MQHAAVRTELTCNMQERERRRRRKCKIREKTTLIQGHD